ncbi:MAG: hypothetical protein PHG25_00440 [Candidatus Pacebacteria bacterium]|nr:hypothetical protein [Candidatus Paceibacterota bacterium]
MKSLHDFLSRTVPAYYSWHKHPLAGTTHWVSFMAISCVLTANLLFAVNSYAQTVDGNASTTEDNTIVTEQTTDNSPLINTESTSTVAVPAETIDQASSTQTNTTDTAVSVVVPAATSTDSVATTTDTNTSSTETPVPSPIIGGITSEHTASSSSVTTENVAINPDVASTTKTEDKIIAKIDDVVPKVLPKIISLNDGLVVPSGSKETEYVTYPIFVFTKENIEINSNPTGISCGAICSHKFTFGTKVILTATQDDAQSILIWKGCESMSGKSCVVTASNSRMVTVTTR